VVWEIVQTVVTVFSASCYEPHRANRSGVLRVREDLTVCRNVMPALQRMPRSTASFYSMIHPLLDAPARSLKRAERADVVASHSDVSMLLRLGKQSRSHQLRAPTTTFQMTSVPRSRSRTFSLDASRSFPGLPPEVLRELEQEGL
jgi:hypothetical protein